MTAPDHKVWDIVEPKFTELFGATCATIHRSGISVVDANPMVRRLHADAGQRGWHLADNPASSAAFLTMFYQVLAFVTKVLHGSTFKASAAAHGHLVEAPHPGPRFSPVLQLLAEADGDDDEPRFAA